jgi:hypothetical protein
MLPAAIRNCHGEQQDQVILERKPKDGITDQSLIVAQADPDRRAYSAPFGKTDPNIGEKRNNDDD